MVEVDYGMTGGVSVTGIRAFFLWNFLKRFGIEADATAKPPQDQQIILLSRDYVMTVLASGQEA